MHAKSSNGQEASVVGMATRGIALINPMNDAVLQAQELNQSRVTFGRRRERTVASKGAKPSKHTYFNMFIFYHSSKGEFRAHQRD